MRYRTYKDCKFNSTQFRKLLNFAGKDTHFVFDGQLLDQIDGGSNGITARAIFG